MPQLGAKPLPFVNAKDYGAQGDNLTNDTAALQAALNSGAKYVYIPEGDYLIDPITVPTRVSVVGAGQRKTQLFARTGTSTAFISLSADTDEFVELRGFSVSTRKAQNPSTNCHGIYLDGVAAGGYASFADAYLLIRDILLFNCGGHSIFLDGVRGVRVENVHSNAPGVHGFYIVGTDNHISNCTSADTADGGNHGFEVAGSNNTFTGCKAFYCGTTGGNNSDGWRVTAGRNMFAGCEAQDNGRHGFNFTGSGGDCAVSGCISDSNGNTGFNIDNTTAVENIALVGFAAFSRSGGRYTQAKGVALSNAPVGCMIVGTAKDNTTDISGTYGNNQLLVSTTDGGKVNNIIGASVEVATTGASGYTLVNGTGTVLSWTAPSDGRLHSILVTGAVVTSSTETGGAFTLSTTTGGVAKVTTIDGGAHSAGTVVGTIRSTLTVDPGSTVTVAQSTALTAGAAKLYLTIQAS